MKFLFKLIGISIALIVIIGIFSDPVPENTPEQNERELNRSNAQQTHSELKKYLTSEAISRANYPATVEMDSYKFTALVGDFGLATYTYTAKNAFNVPVSLVIEITVQLNADLTTKEYTNLIVSKQ